VGEALEAIAYLDTSEQFYGANIVDDGGRLVGHVNVWELLRERNRSRPLGELVKPGGIAATVDMDQEEVAYLMNKYDLTSIPVVDAEGRLVGRITIDDVIDVMKEEASEDILRLAGSDDAELEHASALRSCAVRLPWLLITLGGGFLTSLILREFVGHIAQRFVLSYFVPIVLAMGGNAGIQSSTLVVRRIALGALAERSVLALLLREVLTGILMGLICAAIIGLWARYMIVHDPAGPLPPGLSFVVAIALFSAMTFAVTFGALVPIVLSKCRVDPAVASGPFITIANDVFALLIYFGVTVLLLHRLV
jgi:magnesium transporter